MKFTFTTNAKKRKSKTGSRAQGVERAGDIIDFIPSTSEMGGALPSGEDAREEMDRCHFQPLSSPYYVVVDG